MTCTVELPVVSFIVRRETAPAVRFIAERKISGVLLETRSETPEKSSTSGKRAEADGV